jgi:hypothetical protein
MQSMGTTYPATLSIDYPEKLSRLTTFFRLIVAIPILIIFGLLSANGAAAQGNANNSSFNPSIGAGLVFVPLILMILFRRKYPKWWFDWNLAFTRFSTRIAAYLLLLRDEYPSTDDEQAVHLELAYPDAATELNRWLPLVKWLLAFPHYIILIALVIGLWVVTIISWFAIMITGRYPKGFFNYVVGVMRWELRVSAYAFLLTTDRYPSFSLDA